jgi:hypothetical protein
MTIYQIRENGQLTEMKAQLWDSTASLKQLLMDNPSLLAGEQIDPIDPRRWLSISTELSVPSGVYDQERGVVDHLFVDQDAMPTLVQVVTSDGENYGEILVAQLLDYAAHAVTYWSIAVLQDQFLTYWRSRNRDSEDVLQDFLESGTEKEIFWQQVQHNLQQGRIRLVFISDYIAPSLQHLVEFLNIQMDHAEVLAVEINKYTSDNLEIIVPKLIGITPASQRKSITPRPGNQWDEASFIYELTARKATDALGVAQRLLGWAKARKLHLHWGIGRMNGSFAIVLKQESVSYPIVTVGMNQLPNDLKMQFGVPIALTPFQKKEKRQELLQRFPKIQGMRIVEDAESLSFFVSSRQAEVVLDQTFHVLDWIIHEISS